VWWNHIDESWHREGERFVIPFAEIIEAADRRWTFQLLDRFIEPDLQAEEREQIVAALTSVSDRRAVPILERLLTDPSRPPLFRESASEILRGMQYLDIEWPEATLRKWWHSEDTVLRRHALLSMSRRSCPDLVRSAADSPHPLRREALRRMTFHFDKPSDLRFKVMALCDPDPSMRETAATILFWDEPVMAEQPLVTASTDTDGEVAVEAITTLQYYPTTRVIRCLHGLIGHPVERVRVVARKSLEEIRRDCLRQLLDCNPRVADRVRDWLEPVWSFLAFTPEELSPTAEEPYTPSSLQKSPPPPVSEMLGLLADSDTSPKVLQDHLWASSWEQYPKLDRKWLRPVLLNHDDPLVREFGTVPLQEWNDTEGLLTLASDTNFGVRKSAFYRLGLLPVDRRIAVVAWGNLQQPNVYGVHARETLSSFVAHANQHEAVPKLTAIAIDPL
jgi:HEAT repeat protein